MSHSFGRYQSFAGEPGMPSVIVLRQPDRDGSLTCDGVEMTPAAPIPCSSNRANDAADPSEDAIRVGTRFVDDVSGLVLRCTRSGRASVIAYGRRIMRSSASLTLAIAETDLPK
jgi:hypothetical protein